MEASNPTADPKKVEDQSKDNLISDEYGFPISNEPRLLESYQKFEGKHKRRTERLLSGIWKDVKASSLIHNKQKMRELIAAGVPKDHRIMLWLVTSGGYKLKANANANTESGSYYNEMVERNKKAKPMEAQGEIDKDLGRTFPGHPFIESEEGQEKMRRVLECYARRNKSIGYCQSMNFIAGISLIANNGDEEDAFWVLTTVVEKLCAGIYSKAMFNIQVDSLVLGELLNEKLPDLYKHMTKKHVSPILLATKWFMCLFVGALPTETVFRVWDYFFYCGAKVLFAVGIAILYLLQDELLKTKDPMTFCNALLRGSLTFYDWKKLIKTMDSYEDITKVRVEFLRRKHKANIENGITSIEDVEQVKTMINNNDNSWVTTTNDVITGVSSTYKAFTSAFGSLYKKSKNNYSDYVTKKLAEKATKNNFELVPASLEPKVVDCAANHLNKSIDFINNGIGVRYYTDGKKYKGSFKNNNREGFGTLSDSKNNVIYKGDWKSDKRDGNGHGVDSHGNKYKGEWKNDEHHGKGHMKYISLNVIYEGDWKSGKQEGKGSMMYPNGDRYDGDWKNNKKEGVGSFYWGQTGNKYEGEWKNDKQEGKGVFVNVSGDVYDGEWVANSMHGKGSMIYANGDKYDGDWKNGKREGKGVLNMANSDVYEGEWKNDKFHGFGFFTYEMHTLRYEGQWASGLRIDANGNRYSPTGELVSEAAKEESVLDDTPKTDFSGTIMARLKPSSNSASLTSLSRKPNTFMNKAIEDIKRKNVQ